MIVGRLWCWYVGVGNTAETRFFPVDKLMYVEFPLTCPLCGSLKIVSLAAVKGSGWYGCKKCGTMWRFS